MPPRPPAEDWRKYELDKTGLTLMDGQTELTGQVYTREEAWSVYRDIVAKFDQTSAGEQDRSLRLPQEWGGLTF